MTESALVLLATLALGACGGAESGDPAREAPAAAVEATPVEAGAALTPRPADPAGEPVASAPARPGAQASAPAAQAGAPSAGAAPAEASPPARPAPARAEAAAPPAEAAAILQRAERAYAAVRSMQADFVQDLTVPLLDSTQRSRGKIYHRRPDRFLMKFSEPAGDIVVADGRSLWMYYPSSDPKQVVRTSVGDAGQHLDLQREFLSNPVARFNATLHGVEAVGGRPAHLLTLVPRQDAPYQRVRIWVDREDALVRRFEITEQNETVRRLELRNLRPNVPLDDALFRFSPPPNTQVFEQ